MNERGSTPFHLAVQNTGRSDSGSDAAKDQQRQLIGVLLRHGARPTDTDSNGKTVMAAAASDWIRELLAEKSGNHLPDGREREPAEDVGDDV